MAQTAPGPQVDALHGLHLHKPIAVEGFGHPWPSRPIHKAYSQSLFSFVVARDNRLHYES